MEIKLNLFLTGFIPARGSKTFFMMLQRYQVLLIKLLTFLIPFIFYNHFYKNIFYQYQAHKGINFKKHINSMKK